MPDAVKDYIAIIVAAGVTLSIVIILLLAWGLAWRWRWVTARRRARTLLLDDDDFLAREYQPRDDPNHVPPVWVERWVDLKKAGRDGQWARIIPLSMTIAMHSDPKGEVGNEHDQTAQTSIGTTLVLGPSASMHLGCEFEPIQSTAPPEVYVTIVVAMPQNPDIHGAPGYEFGVAKAPVGHYSDTIF